MIERTEHTITVPHLPDDLRGLRVVHLTDFHRSKYTADSTLREAVRLANASCPDLILLTGDFVTKDPADIGPCQEILARLCAPLGVYAVLGNHDYYTDAAAMERALIELEIPVLTNQSLRLEGGLHLVGIEDDRHGTPDPERAFAEVAPETPVLTLIHNPALIELFPERTCTAFAGHTHGGQIRLPYLTTRQVRRIGAKHYRAGWFRVGNTRLYVNRGLGCVGMPLRFFCPPEVALFTLT